jgi:hypothetical protein
MLDRSALGAALVYAALALLMVSPALPPGRTLSASDALWSQTPWRSPAHAAPASNVQLDDSYRVFQPFLQRTREVLPQVPLWNPYLMAGRPFLGNGQSSVFSPFSVPAYVLPFWRSLALVAALKLFVAAFGAYLLGRTLGMRWAGALLAGVVFGFSLWFVAWLSWPTTSTWALLPWLWLGADVLARRPGPLPAAGFSAAVGLQFLGGHPQSSFHVLAATVLFFGLRLAVHLRGQGRALPARVGAFAGSMLLGVALAGLTLVPLLELLGRASDASDRAAFGDIHTPARYLLGLFDYDHWGRPTQVVVDSFGSPFLHTRAFYVGGLTLMLTAIALTRGASLERIGVAALGAVSLAIAVGAPPFFELVGALPGFRVTNNARLTVVFVLCAALLAGWGLTDVLERRAGRRLPVALAAALLAVPVVWVLVIGQRPWGSTLWDGLRDAWLFRDPGAPGVGASELQRFTTTVRTAALFEWLLPAASGLLLIAAAVRGRARPEVVGGVAVAIVAVDLFRAGVGLNPAVDVDRATQPATPAIRALQADRPNRFVGLGFSRPLGPGSALPPDVAMRYGLFDARGYDFPVEARFRRYWRREVAGAGCAYHFCTSGAGAAATSRAARALSLLSVSSLLTAPDDPVPRWPGLRRSYAGADARIYSNPAAVPRAFLVGGQTVTRDGDSALRAVTAHDFQPLRTAVTEEAVPGVMRGRAAAAGWARITSYEAERVDLSVSAPRRRLLVLTDAYYPGWKAEVDGHPAPIHRADYLFRAVSVPAGRHRVEFRYQPASWRIGLGLTCAGLLALLALLVAGAVQARADLKRSIASTGVGSTPSSTAT